MADTHTHHHGAGHDHSAHAALFATFTVTREPKSKVIIKGEIPLEELAKHEDHVLQDLGRNMELKGFRKGHVPSQMIRKQIGELALFTEVAEHTVGHLYPHMIEHFALDPIGRPAIHAEKLAPGNPFAFRIELSVVPEVVLGDYKAAAKKVNAQKEEASVSDTDVDAAIERVQRQKLSYDRLQEKARARAQATADGLTLPTPETTSASTEEEDSATLPLPPLTDEYVKTVGPFETVDAFKAEIRKHLETEKKNEVLSKHRGALTEALIAESTIDLPDVLVESEISQMFGQMEDDLTRAGLTIDGYLEHMQKTREDLKREWTPTAEKRAKTQLILNDIASRETIQPEAEEIEKQAQPLLDAYKDADPVRVRIYVASMLQNEKVMQFLESQ